MTMGKIHSFESMGTVDGPGIRFVVFMGSCPLRCLYCHNIDAVVGDDFKEYSVDDVIEKILKNKPYFDGSGGGVTFTGGEPLMQPGFLKECLARCKEEGIHTTVDTSLFAARDVVEGLLKYVDLWMVSLKHFDDEKHKKLTGVSNVRILDNLKLLSDAEVRLWLRFVLLPEWTDTEENLNALADFCGLTNYEKLELLPYHRMGVGKWNDVGLDYQLEEVKVPEAERVAKVRGFLESRGVKF